MKSSLLGVLFIILLFNHQVVMGYDDEIAHPKITDFAVRKSVLTNFLSRNLGAEFSKDYGSVINGREVIDWITYGSIAEDKEPCRRANHMHNPMNNIPWSLSYMSDDPWWTGYCYLDWGQRYSNVTWATGYLAPVPAAPPPDAQKASFILSAEYGPQNWDKARAYYYKALTEDWHDIRADAFAKTFKSLGHVLHLLQDMAVPAHTRNDFSSHMMRGMGQPYEHYVYANSDLISQANPEFPSFVNNNVTNFWDTDKYNGSNPSTMTDIGLAEFSNANYFSDYTIPNNGTTTEHTFPYPNLSDSNISGPNYQICQQAFAPGLMQRYISRIKNGKPCPSPQDVDAIDHFAAVGLFFGYPDGTTNAYVALDNNVHKTYAQELLPRAVGYSAGLLNYFFRGTLEITAPDRCLYGLIDGSATPYTDDYGNQHQQFTALKAKVKNASYIKDQAGNNIGLEEIKTGTIQAVANYKIRTNYEPGLSTDPPTRASRESTFSYSVSAPLSLTAADITALNSATPKEFSFNFDTSPIPAGITDLYLQVVFKGTLGNEVDNAIAVGMKDLSEPMHHVYWNATDGFYLDGIVRTADQIKGTPALLSRVDRNGDGILEEHIDPYPVKTEIAYCPAQGQTPAYDVIYDPMPEGTFGRLIIIVGADQTEYPLVVHRISTSPLDELTSLFTSFNIINQENDGVFNYAQVYTFRGIAMHAGSAYAKSYPYSSYIWAAPWHAPANNSPIAATTVNP